MALFRPRPVVAAKWKLVIGWLYPKIVEGFYGPLGGVGYDHLGKKL